MLVTTYMILAGNCKLITFPVISFLCRCQQKHMGMLLNTNQLIPLVNMELIILHLVGLL